MAEAGTHTFTKTVLHKENQSHNDIMLTARPPAPSHSRKPRTSRLHLTLGVDRRLLSGTDVSRWTSTDKGPVPQVRQREIFKFAVPSITKPLDFCLSRSFAHQKSRQFCGDFCRIKHCHDTSLSRSLTWNPDDSVEISAELNTTMAPGSIPKASSQVPESIYAQASPWHVNERHCGDLDRGQSHLAAGATVQVRRLYLGMSRHRSSLSLSLNILKTPPQNREPQYS